MNFNVDCTQNSISQKMNSTIDITQFYIFDPIQLESEIETNEIVESIQTNSYGSIFMIDPNTLELRHRNSIENTML